MEQRVIQRSVVGVGDANGAPDFIQEPAMAAKKLSGLLAQEGVDWKRRTLYPCVEKSAHFHCDVDTGTALPDADRSLREESGRSNSMMREEIKQGGREIFLVCPDLGGSLGKKRDELHNNSKGIFA